MNCYVKTEARHGDGGVESFCLLSFPLKSRFNIAGF